MRINSVLKMNLELKLKIFQTLYSRKKHPIGIIRHIEFTKKNSTISIMNFSYDFP